MDATVPGRSPALRGAYWARLDSVQMLLAYLCNKPSRVFLSLHKHTQHGTPLQSCQASEAGFTQNLAPQAAVGCLDKSEIWESDQQFEDTCTHSVPLVSRVNYFQGSTLAILTSRRGLRGLCYHHQEESKPIFSSLVKS